MDKWFARMEDWTSDVLRRLESLGYEEMVSLIEIRQSIIDQFTSELYPEEERLRYRTRMKAILQHDESILKRLNHLKEEAAGEIRKASHVRMQKNAYESNYALDGIFIDKRK